MNCRPLVATITTASEVDQVPLGQLSPRLCPVAMAAWSQFNPTTVSTEAKCLEAEATTMALTLC